VKYTHELASVCSGKAEAEKSTQVKTGRNYGEFNAS